MKRTKKQVRALRAISRRLGFSQTRGVAAESSFNQSAGRGGRVAFGPAQKGGAAA